MGDRIRVGLIGCGNISRQYLATCATFPILDVVACADLLPDAAARRAEAFGLRAMSPEALLAALRQLGSGDRLEAA